MPQFTLNTGGSDNDSKGIQDATDNLKHFFGPTMPDKLWKKLKEKIENRTVEELQVIEKLFTFLQTNPKYNTYNQSINEKDICREFLKNTYGLKDSNLERLGQFFDEHFTTLLNMYYDIVENKESPTIKKESSSTQFAYDHAIIV